MKSYLSIGDSVQIVGPTTQVMHNLGLSGQPITLELLEKEGDRYVRITKEGRNCPIYLLTYEAGIYYDLACSRYYYLQ